MCFPPSSSRYSPSALLYSAVSFLLFYPSIHAEDYIWDTDPNTGYQADSGTWSAGTARWTTNGTTLVNWPGTGNSATFGGADGAYTITVSGTQNVDSIHFGNSGYTLTEGKLNFENNSGITVAAGKTATINAIIIGTGGLCVTGSGQSCVLNLNGDNHYLGVTTIGPDMRLNVSTLANGWSDCAIGISSKEASNLVLNGGTLRFVGTAAAAIDRLFTLAATDNNRIYSSGNGALSFIDSGAIGFSGSGNRSLEFGGTYSDGSNSFAPVIGDGPGGVTSVAKSGSGSVWIFTGNNTYTGTTTISEGILQVGNNGTTGAVAGNIENNATLRFSRSDRYTYEGVIGGSGALIQAGSGSLLLAADSNFSDRTIVQNGSLFVAGCLRSRILIKVERGATLGGNGVCRALVEVDNGGIVAPGVSGPGKFMLDTLSMSAESILRMEAGSPGDTLVLASAGTHTLDGTIDIIATTGFAAGTFRIITFSGTLSGGAHSFTIGTSPEGYGCSLSAGDGYIDLNVTPDPPRIVDQPRSQSIFAGDTACFSISAAGIAPFVYSWHKALPGGDSLLPALTDSLRFAPAALIDSGSYYCIVRNAGGADTSAPAGLIVLQRLPDNRLRLKVEEAASTSVRLVWNAVDTASISAVRIWYGEKTIDTGKFTPGSGLDSITLPPPDASVIISGLTPDTRYCFAIQVCGGTLWSVITGNSRTCCKTLSAPNDTNLVNSIVIDTLYFDSVAASLRISWCVDTAALSHDVQAGITYSMSHYPVDVKGVRIFNLLSPCIDTLIQLHPLRFDTLYYVALWFRTATGTWCEPTADSRDTVRIGRPFRQIITLFDSTAASDTVSVFNGTVALWKDSGYTDMTTVLDTVELFTSATVPEGMIVVGKPFRFKKNVPILPVYIGFRIDSLPSKKTIDDVRIYIDSAGKPVVNHATVVDARRATVYVKTADLKRPFLAMIDTMRPATEFLSDTGTYAFSNSKLEDFLRINDNVANVRWKYFYGKGDRAPLLMQEDGSYHTGDYIKLTISDTMQAISSESGLRAYLVISDGIHCDTINMSRPVWRSESDNLTTEANIWTPVYPTAELLHKAGDSLIGRLPTSDSVGYDQRYVRLYRWVNHEGNSGSSEKWVEYHPDNADIRSLFTLEPGRMVWLKTRGNIPLHLGPGATLSLKDTFSIDLPPKQWTDFGMPYRFGVRMEEILSASGNDVDPIQFYRWKRDQASNLYFLEPLYVPGMPDCLDRSKTIEYMQRGGYSFHNRSPVTVRLRIPPIPEAMVKRLAGIARGSASSWSAKFIAQSDNGIRFPAVYFGYAPGMRKSAYPPAPSFASLRMSLFDRTTALRYGHHIDEDADKGLVSELIISNNTDSTRTIRYHLERTGAFPEHYSACCFDAAAKTPDTNGTAAVAPKSTASRWIVVGDAAFRQNFIAAVMPLRFLLLAPRPNPARSVVAIRYTVPFGAQERIRIAVYTILGKRVWGKRIDGLPAGGAHVAVWNGRDAHGSPVGSGLYIVRLKVVDSRGRIVEQFDQRVTWMR
ncbi:MAG: autotransporter-associated beta strand repeat-containing protein [Chitinispirillaceae bacterium]|nr:autotransporter-associated beta strand repeat-containing protein [Chitinispirillaceae bacterium]